METGGGVGERDVESLAPGVGSSGWMPVTETGWMPLLLLLVAITLPGLPVAVDFEFVVLN